MENGFEIVIASQQIKLLNVLSAMGNALIDTYTLIISMVMRNNTDADMIRCHGKHNTIDTYALHHTSC